MPTQKTTVAAQPAVLPHVPPVAPPAVLPDGIEIFRAGRHIDDAGITHNFSESDLAGMASGYNPALREAPLTVGHPKDNLPAYGWVKAVARNAAGVLTIAAHNVEPQFAEMVAAKRFPKRSASFYPPQSPNNPTPGQWYLRHVAFLGAQPPAIAGLKDIQFSEGDAAGAVNFSEPDLTKQEPDDMSKELQAQLDESNAKLQSETAARKRAETEAATHKQTATDAQAKAASFAEKAKADRKAGFVSFAEGQVKAGRLTPKDKDMAVAALDALADSAPVEFAEGDTTRKVSPSQWLQDLISGTKPAVEFGEFAGDHAATTHAGAGAGAGGAKGKSDAEIDTAAKAYARQNKVSYAEALTAVTTFTS